MSAYIVGVEHIDFILTAALKAEHVSHFDKLDQIGQMLVDENKRSVDFRYEEENDAQLYTFKPFPLEYNRWDVDLALRGYRYQSCEHEAWDTSAAAAWTDSFIARNKADFTAADYQAKDDDSNRGWSVEPGYPWTEGESEGQDVLVPNYRSGEAVQ